MNTSPAIDHAIILFAHGARDPAWAEPFARLQQRIAARQPDTTVRLAFLELMQPTLAQCVAALVADGVSDIMVVPAFMARGAHLRRDLPLLLDEVRARYPQISFSLTEALGETDVVLDAMADWVCTGARVTG